MKYLVFIEVIIMIMLFCSCKDNTKNHQQIDSDNVNITCETDSQAPEQKETKYSEPVTVKPHNISRLVNRDEYLINKKSEDVFNAINAKDNKKMVDMFSSQIKSNVSDLDEQITTLFKFIGEPIIDYAEGIAGGGEHTDYGQIIEKDLNTVIYFKTSNNYEYMLWINYIYKDEDKGKEGIEYIVVCKKEDDDYFTDESIKTGEDIRPWSNDVLQGVLCYVRTGRFYS